MSRPLTRTPFRRHDDVDRAQIREHLALTPAERLVAQRRMAEFLGMIELLDTTIIAGDLDIAFVPTGTDGHDDLVERAVEFEIGDIRVRVASLDDIIHSKRTAARPRDLATLPLLEALRDELA